MSDDLREQIHAHLVNKSTEELLEIWQRRDDAEWQGDVFDPPGGPVCIPAAGWQSTR